MSDKNTLKLIRITTIPLSLKILLRGQLRFMSEHFEVIGVSSDGKELSEVQQEENIRVIPINMSREITPLNDLKALYQMCKLIKKEKPDIVHTHTPKAGIIGMLAAKYTGVPYRLHTVAGMPLTESSGFKRRILNFVEKLTYSCATKVYPNSYGLYEFILKQKFTSTKKLKVIGNGSSNGIDTSYFSSRNIEELELAQLKQQLNISLNDFVFIFVGRMVTDKGINELIRAFCKLNVMECKLLLVGPFENDLDPLEKETLNAIENNPNIISIGFQKDVRPYFAISDALVFPSYREGFPNVVMQAGAMELPAIVSDINGCNEIIENGVNGIIIPSKDIDSLKFAMQKLIDDVEFKLSLKRNARRMIVERYEQKVIWESLLQEYQTLIQNLPNQPL